MSERDDLTEQAFHTPLLPEVHGVPLEKGHVMYNEAHRLANLPVLPLNKMQSQVREFHLAMGQPVHDEARALPEERKAVRIELIREEFMDELLPALRLDDMVETVDAGIDLLYVVVGMLTEMGVNIAVCFDEVHRSNMSKLGLDGRPIIAGPNDPDGIFEGRVKKGPNYSRPDLRTLLESGVADLKLGYDA